MIFYSKKGRSDVVKLSQESTGPLMAGLSTNTNSVTDLGTALGNVFKMASLRGITNSLKLKCRNALNKLITINTI